MKESSEHFKQFWVKLMGEYTADYLHWEARSKAIEMGLLLLYPRDRTVITLNFGLEGEKVPVRDIALRLNVSRERVNQIRYRAMRNLRLILLGKNDSESMELELTLSHRSRNCLRRRNLRTFQDLSEVTAGELLMIRGFGRKSLLEVQAILAERGLTLKSEPNRG